MYHDTEKDVCTAFAQKMLQAFALSTAVCPAMAHMQGKRTDGKIVGDRKFVQPTRKECAVVIVKPGVFKDMCPHKIKHFLKGKYFQKGNVPKWKSGVLKHRQTRD